MSLGSGRSHGRDSGLGWSSESSTGCFREGTWVPSSLFSFMAASTYSEAYLKLLTVTAPYPLSVDVNGSFSPLPGTVMFYNLVPCFYTASFGTTTFRHPRKVDSVLYSLSSRERERNTSFGGSFTSTEASGSFTRGVPFIVGKSEQFESTFSLVFLGFILSTEFVGTYDVSPVP